jgi:heme exporter protein D
MNWGSLDAFFAMGGHGLYVWASYAMALLLLLLEPWLTRRRQHRAWRDAGDASGLPQGGRP